MNKQDLQGVFSKIHASEELVKEVISMKKDKKQFVFSWGRAIRLTAVAAVVVALLITGLTFWPATGNPDPEKPGIIAMPGVLKVYACDTEEAEKLSFEAFELTDTIDSYNRIWMPFVSLKMGYGIPLTFQFPDDVFTKLEFHITVEYGKFSLKIPEGEKYLGDEAIIQNGETVIWRGGKLSEAAEIIGRDNEFFAYILIFAESHIVGYGIIRFAYYAGEDGMLPTFIAENFSTVYFPLVDGQYQAVTEEYVYQQIEANK